MRVLRKSGSFHEGGLGGSLTVRWHRALHGSGHHTCRKTGAGKYGRLALEVGGTSEDMGTFVHR